MPLSRLPLSLQHCLLLEWLSPEAVSVVASISTALRESVVSSPLPFRAAQKEILSDACIRWFQENNVPLHLWRERVESEEETRLSIVHLSNGCVHSTDDQCAVALMHIGTKAWIRQEWYRFGRRHRDGDRPAVVRERDGREEWYQDGKLHRDGDKPAITLEDGTQVWFQHGQLHRDGDMPAVLLWDSTREWRQYGLLHREDDRPARILKDGSTFWYCRGALHRERDGPAVIWADGTAEWYRHGEWVPNEHSAKTTTPRVRYFSMMFVGPSLQLHGWPSWFRPVDDGAHVALFH